MELFKDPLVEGWTVDGLLAEIALDDETAANLAFSAAWRRYKPQINAEKNIYLRASASICG